MRGRLPTWLRGWSHWRDVVCCSRGYTGICSKVNGNCVPSQPTVSAHINSYCRDTVHNISIQSLTDYHATDFTTSSTSERQVITHCQIPGGGKGIIRKGVLVINVRQAVTCNTTCNCTNNCLKIYIYTDKYGRIISNEEGYLQ